jgi:succinate dehydrogenase / fumarate reductase, cytochrome b subunit
MAWVIDVVKSSLGAKALMALSGLALVGFVLIHMLGNLQVFLGQDTFNAYAAMLKGNALVLWGARIVLLAAVLLHIAGGLRLAALNRKARPVGYSVYRPRAATLFGRYMALSGLVVMAFIVYHLLHFTIGVVHSEHFILRDALGRHDVYSMFVRSFQNPVVSCAYIVAILLLGMHLWHGVASTCQSLGLNTPKYRPLIETLGTGLAFVVVVGNCAMPIAVLLGFLS